MVKTTRVAASILGILCLAACGGGDSQQHVAAQLSVESPSTDVCVAMAGGNARVGGLQIDLTWDSACMTVARTGGAATQCASNPSTGKSVETALLSDAQMRAIFLSVSDTSPVPDGELFCCKFAVAPGAQADPCCSIDVTNLILAGPTGHRLYDPTITVQASVGGTACDASAPKTPIPGPIPPPVPPMGS
jgi:hypothetical protein